MIKIENVNKYFYRHKKNEIHVINNTSLELGETGLVALLGPSGCGKTTLLNVIGGLDKVNKGKIFINGQRITRKSSSKIDKIRNLNIGYIFQDYYLIDTMSVYDNIALSLRITGIKNKEEIKKRVNFVLEKVGMYRYRNRYANMLSGGERQRVGIARAIVKDPSIIIADEPTGNLDSKNSLEIMNIIKAISKDRLVILVTHERELAEFYASRILEIEDGKIVEDKKNEHTNDLDYRMDNKLYLKDFENHKKMSADDISINFYSSKKEKLDINIVVQNGNIYIESKSKEKLELVDDDSSIEFVDDHYKKISKSIYEEYNFDFDKVIDKSYKKKYTSIFNPISLIFNGFKKVRDYSFVKKLLLLGFFASGLFITYSISSLFGITDIKDKDFVTVNKNYLKIISQEVKVKDFLAYEKDENINYIIPGDSIVYFNIKYNDYYQTSRSTNSISGSLSGISMISEKDIVYGEFPQNKRELVFDKRTLGDYITNGIPKQVGIKSEKEMIGRTITIENMGNFKIVGMTDLGSPSIYAYESEFINIIANSGSGDIVYRDMSMEKGIGGVESQFLDYNLVKGDIKLKKGKWPKNDYEVIVNYNYKDQYKLNKKIDVKINGTKLKVVGYYTSKTNMETLLVSNRTIKYNIIVNTADMVVYANDKTSTIEKYRDIVNIQDSYKESRKSYIESNKDTMISSLVFCGVVLLISLIEIFLMIRSSFLSRIKEVGIYRAIGVKKKDIYKMFIGEIIAITTIASMIGVALMSYVIYELSFISYLANRFMINTKVIIISIIFIYIFNLIIGLLPVRGTIRKTPAQILSRSDI